MPLPDLSQLQDMLSNAQSMQHDMEQKLSATIVEADTGGGMVKVRMNGRKELLRLTIAPTALGSTPADLELLEDLITAAVNQAGRKADEAMQSQTANLLGSLDLPGLT